MQTEGTPLAKLKMQISVTFEGPTSGIYAEWKPTEQARAIEADMQRVMRRYITEELHLQGVDIEPSIALLVCAA